MKNEINITAISNQYSNKTLLLNEVINLVSLSIILQPFLFEVLSFHKDQYH